MKILALCGSIRKDSSNQSLLKAVRSFLPQGIQWWDFEIKELPFFDPQLQFSQDLPSIVQSLREQAQQADYIIISTPEYAHGIPGVLKNALEWLLCEETMKKRVIVFVASPSGGDHVKAYLLETLKTMDMLSGPDSTLIVRSARTYIAASGDVGEQSLRIEIESFVNRNIISHSASE